VTAGRLRHSRSGAGGHLAPRLHGAA
jgi:hypothetical protein